jgi:predicted acylesterase/phospholipase RssA
MAPFAFLGSEWDERLTDAYTGGHAAQLWNLTRLAPTLDGGLFRPAALDGLIDPFIDAELVEAVAREHALGRRLLVATTDLDTEQPCIWDMGEIASRGGEPALKLFRKVLAASASLPGLFPPRRFPFEADGVEYEEMHLDGGLAAPLFVMPEAMLRWKLLGQRLSRSRVYVIVNMSLDQVPRTTEPNLPTILLRSFDTMLRFSYRQALSLAATFCANNDLPLSVASIPADPAAGNMLTFDTKVMRSIYDAAVERAQSGTLWATLGRAEAAQLMEQPALAASAYRP